jgi:hypothetical protein
MADGNTNRYLLPIIKILIEQGPKKNSEIAAILGCARNVPCKITRQLHDAGLVHVVDWAKPNGRGAYAQLWAWQGKPCTQADKAKPDLLYPKRYGPPRPKREVEEVVHMPIVISEIRNSVFDVR